jgi:hypothetical protein
MKKTKASISSHRQQHATSQQPSCLLTKIQAVNKKPRQDTSKSKSKNQKYMKFSLITHYSLPLLSDEKLKIMKAGKSTDKTQKFN